MTDNNTSNTAQEYTLGPDSQVQDGVPKGTITQYTWETSRIFENTFRKYWVYVPSQYDASKPACVMVFQDGETYVDVNGDTRVPVVFDNLIHKGDMPVTIGIFIDAGNRTDGYVVDAKDWYDEHANSQRSLEYDTLSDRYARFLIEEILPEVGKSYNLAQDAASRAICGISSGGICSWTVAWERPDAFTKVLSHVGSFADIRGGHVYPTLIRKTPKKPIRVFLQAGSGDLDVGWGNWPISNLNMAAALNFVGYDYRLEYGDGEHNCKHAGAILPESLEWLWR